MRKILVLLLVLGIVATGVSVALPGDSQTIPTGQTITPSGRLTTVGTFPNGLAVSPDGAITVVTSSSTVGATLPPGEINIIDSSTGLILQKIAEQDVGWGVAFDQSGSELFVSGGSTNQVYRFTNSNGVFLPGSSINVPGFAGSLVTRATTSGQTQLFVAMQHENQIESILLPQETTTMISNVSSPFGLAIKGDTLYASDWRGTAVTSINLNGGRQSIAVGDHPEGLAFAGNQLLVANANDATLSFVDPGTGLQTQQLSLALDPSTPTDSPSAVSVHGTFAYVTLAASNAVAVVDIPAKAVRGYVPTAWYPSAIEVSHGRLTVLDARGIGALPVSTTTQTQLNELGGSPYDTAYGTSGVLETMPIPDSMSLAQATALVRTNNASHSGSIPPAIKHVIYVVRENKTYDEVLGDMPQGNGDPAYTLFPQVNTPNAHAIASRFVLSDNFFDPGEASATGHFWTDAGGPTDIAERQWHTQGLNVSWSDQANYPAAGLLLDSARAHGVSYRAYDEELYDNFHQGSFGQYEAPQSVYHRHDLGYSDLLRITGDAGSIGWNGEFQQFASHACTGALAATYGANCELPTLEYVYLGGDHAAYGQQGKPTPPSSVADNDAAIGKLVELVSKSSYWSSTAIVMVDDDPQSGGDHVSPYRGLILVASPFARAGTVVHTRYSLASAVRFVEAVAGLPPLSQFDAMSRPLDDFFTASPPVSSFDPYAALPETIPFHVFLSPNPFAARGHMLVGEGGPDRIKDDHAATNLLWEIVRGYSLDEFLAHHARAR